MKFYWLVAILLLFVIGCKDNTSYNLQNKKFDIAADYLAILKDFEYAIQKDSSTIQHTIWYNLKSKKPYRVNEQGKWFYRWSIRVQKYVSPAIANQQFQLEKEELEQYNMDRAMLLKGNNGRILLTENYIYTLSASCKEGRHVEEWFTLLQHKLLVQQQARAHTVLDIDCGGGWSLN